MPVYKTEAIVIRRANLGEADRVLTLFSREYGKLSAVAKGARKPRSRFAGRLELFTQMRALLARGKTLDVISQVDVIEPFAALRTDLSRVGAASSIAEITDRATPEREPQPAIYSVLRQSLRMAVGPDPELGAIWFSAQILGLSGYGPVVDRCVVCGKPIKGSAVFSFALGGSLCANDRERDPEALAASAVALASIGFLSEVSASALSRVQLERRQRAEVETLLRRYVEYRFEVKLKSPPVIERLSRPG